MKIPKEEDINKVLAGESTPDMAKQVAAWFATDEGALYLEERIDADFNSTILEYEAKSLSDNIQSVDIINAVQNKIRRRTIVIRFAKVAAILFPFLCFISSFLLINSRLDLFGTLAYEEVYVPKGENMQIIFQDGSKAYLDSDTRLKYPKKFAFGKREVYLDGQGYFEVNSSKSWPFIVNLSGPSIKVLGTSFNVNAYSTDEEITIILKEGKINFTTNPDSIYDLTEGNHLFYNRITSKCYIHATAQHNNEEAFNQNEIIFENTPLAQVIKTLNRKYNIHFILSPDITEDIRFSIQFQDNNIDEIIKDLAKISTLHFEYIKDTNHIIIKKHD